MEDEGYKPGGTVGGKWGCALAGLVGVPLFMLATLVSALGDCAPDVECKRGPPLVLLALGIAATIGFGSRAIINWLIRRRQKRP